MKRGLFLGKLGSCLEDAHLDKHCPPNHAKAEKIPQAPGTLRLCPCSACSVQSQASTPSTRWALGVPSPPVPPREVPPVRMERFGRSGDPRLFGSVLLGVSALLGTPKDLIEQSWELNGTHL